MRLLYCLLFASLSACSSTEETPGADAGTGGAAGGGSSSGRQVSGGGPSVDASEPPGGSTAGGSGPDSGADDAGEPQGGEPGASVSSPAEQCTNGVDDDGNGMTDCEDPACGAFQCVAVPDGWQGPVALARGASAVDVACAGSFSKTVFVGSSDLAVADATCPSCECRIADSTCTLNIGVFDQAGCPGDPTTGYAPVDGTGCWRVDSGASYRLSWNIAGTTECTSVTVGAPELPEPTWGGAARACAPPTQGAGCAGGAVCTSLPAAPLQQNLCVLRHGVNDCPAGFPERTLFYASYEDTRHCSACSCGSARCDSEVGLYTNRACDNGEQPVTVAEETCAPFTDDTPATGASLYFDDHGPQCTPSPSTLSGDVTAGNATTVCCSAADQ